MFTCAEKEHNGNRWIEIGTARITSEANFWYSNWKFNRGIKIDLDQSFGLFPFFCL